VLLACKSLHAKAAGRSKEGTVQTHIVSICIILLSLFGDASSRFLNIESKKPRDQADLNIVNKDAPNAKHISTRASQSLSQSHPAATAAARCCQFAADLPWKLS